MDGKMSVWAIIPVKPLNRAKSRLSGVLSPEQRHKLAESMFRHVLQVIRTVPQITGTLVISRDTKALAIARDYGAYTVQESGAPELNAALMRATQVVAGWRTNAVLVLPADLPLIASQDITGILQMGQYGPVVVLATDQNGDGTNAMLIRPPGLITYAYGVGSFQRHSSLAKEAGAELRVYHSERLMLDIDLPEDLKTYQSLIQQDEIDLTQGLLIPGNAS